MLTQGVNAKKEVIVQREAEKSVRQRSKQRGAGVFLIEMRWCVGWTEDSNTYAVMERAHFGILKV
jgi:hypothetical protein